MRLARSAAILCPVAIITFRPTATPAPSTTPRPIFTFPLRSFTGLTAGDFLIEGHWLGDVGGTEFDVGCLADGFLADLDFDGLGRTLISIAPRSFLSTSLRFASRAIFSSGSFFRHQRERRYRRDSRY